MAYWEILKTSNALDLGMYLYQDWEPFAVVRVEGKTVLEDTSQFVYFLRKHFDDVS